MSHLVIVEVAAGRESLPADPALVRLLPRVDPPVGVEAGAGAEPFLTLRADVGLLASVGPVMCNVSQCKCSKNTGYFQSQFDDIKTISGQGSTMSYNDGFLVKLQ